MTPTGSHINFAPLEQPRVDGIVEMFVALKEDLESKMRSMQRSWTKRERRLERAIANASGMYGDLQGIIGVSLSSIPCLEHLLIESSAVQNGDEHVPSHTSE